MDFCVDWTLFVKVSTSQKCERIIDTVQKALGISFSQVTKDRYWKDKSLFKVDAKSCVTAPATKDAFYAIMTAANGLARRWVVNGPTEGGIWEFAGTAEKSSIRIQGIESIDFRSASNIELAGYGSPTSRAG